MQRNAIEQPEPTIDLVQRAQQGDAPARDELFGRYSERVLDIVRIRLRARPKLRAKEQSSDLLQASLLEALKGLDAFEMRDESSLIRWLSRVVERVILNRLDYYEAEKRDMDRERPLDGAPRGEDDGPAPELPGSGGGPSRPLHEEEGRALVLECIAALPERYREVIVMRDYEDVPWSEVVQRLGTTSENGARMIHLRAVEKLGECLRRRHGRGSEVP
jgi:RNA polymerase sigma-70 factor (subfamily 1)